MCHCTIITICRDIHVSCNITTTGDEDGYLNTDGDDSRKDDWDSWSHHFDQWLSISSYATGDDVATKKRAVFCTFIGLQTFKLLCTLCTPTRPEDCSYEDLKAKLNRQLAGIRRTISLTNRRRNSHIRLLSRTPSFSVVMSVVRRGTCR